MKKILLLITSSLIILFPSCVKEDHFGYSSFANINAIEISNQASQAVIDHKEYSISVEFPGGIDLTELTIQSITVSSFASSDLVVGDTVNFTEPVTIKVTAEDESVQTWILTAFIASSTPQLANSNFNDWYQTSSGYYEPGTDATSTIWGTGNPGTQILNLLATTRLEVESGNYAVKMETLDNGFLAGTFGTPISAGSVFTGVFDSDNIVPSDPQAAIDFGTPFSGRPSTFKFSYEYTPGPENKDKQGTVLPDGDQCDIYAILEVRGSTSTQRLATAWFRDGATQSNTIKEIEFVYGELDSSYPSYMYPTSGGYVSTDSAQFVLPTHITVVASSSFDGANFAGAIGSVLILDDIEMVY